MEIINVITILIGKLIENLVIWLKLKYMWMMVSNSFFTSIAIYFAGETFLSMAVNNWKTSFTYNFNNWLVKNFTFFHLFLHHMIMYTYFQVVLNVLEIGKNIQTCRTMKFVHWNLFPLTFSSLLLGFVGFLSIY